MRVTAEYQHGQALKRAATAAAMAALEGQPVPVPPPEALTGISAADIEVAIAGLQQRHQAASAAAAGCDGAINARRATQWAVAHRARPEQCGRYEAIAAQLGPLCGSIAALAELAKTPVNLSRLHVPALRGNTKNSDLSLLSGLEVYGPHVERARMAIERTLATMQAEPEPEHAAEQEAHGMDQPRHPPQWCGHRRGRQCAEEPAPG